MQIYLAPIRGHTDYIFRNTLVRIFNGVDVCFAPFITTVKGSSIKDSHIRDVLPKYNKSNRVVPQIIGKEPEEFVVLAKQLIGMGYKSINWNLGCPYPMVVNKKRGAGLLPYPEMINDFLKNVIPHITGGFSIKLRLGKNDPDEIFQILPVLNDFPIEEIIIHPRTAQQMYGGSVDLDTFEKCLSLSKHPVVYNGDIVDLKSYEKIATRFPSISRFMIGRGLAMNPALAEIIKNPHAHVPKDNRKKIYRFHEEILRGYMEQGGGPLSVLGKMKQLWWYLSSSIPGREEILTKIQRTKTLETYKEIIEDVFR